MPKSMKIFLGTSILFVILILPMLSGCKGSETREKVDDTVEELAGKKKVDQMKKMEKNISDISEKQTERMNDLDAIDPDEEE
jgi:hypothetical protein